MTDTNSESERAQFVTWFGEQIFEMFGGLIKARDDAEDKALKYAKSVTNLFHQHPDQLAYILRLLEGDRYRREHKDVKVSLRTQLTSTNTREKIV